MEASYAALRETVVDLTAQLDELASRGRVPTAVLNRAKAALSDGDLDLAQAIVDGLIDDPTFEEIAREQAELHHIAGTIALQQLDYATAMARHVRAAQLAPANAGYQNGARYAASLAGDFAKAEAFARRYLRLVQETGDDAEDRARALNNLAFNLNAQGRFAEAEPLYAQALNILREVLGDTHPSTFKAAVNAARNLADMDRHAEADALALEILGPDHRIRLRTLPAMAGADENAAGFEPAAASWVEALRLAELHASAPLEAALWQQNLATLRQKQGRYDEADALYAQAFPVLLKGSGDDRPALAHLAANYARNLRTAPPSPDRTARLAELQARFGEAVGTDDDRP